MLFNGFFLGYMVQILIQKGGVLEGGIGWSW